MFVCVARLRRLSAILLFTVAAAPLASCRDDTLFTSSVSYCSPPQSLLIQRLNIAYIAHNHSVSFNISAASVEPNINVSASVLLNVYGLPSVNLTINLCTLLHGALCPLPTYNFTGADNIALPASTAQNVAARIPRIAYGIPDLESFAQLELVEEGTGVVKACVQATLANGWSTRQAGVEWATGGVALLALFSALYHTLPWKARATATAATYAKYIPSATRLLDLVSLFQSIALSALLNLNYPLVYRSFALNFAWSAFLFSCSSSLHTLSSSIQNTINTMRHKTGGRMPDGSGGSSTDLVNRRLSPYNVPPAQGFVVPQSLLEKVARLPVVDFGNGRGAPLMLSAASSASSVPGSVVEVMRRDVATVTPESPNVLQAGVPVYVNSLGLGTANAFMSVLIYALLFAAILLVAFGVGYGVLAFISTRRRMEGEGGGETEKVREGRRGYKEWAKGWGVRFGLIIYPPLITFAFYQWTLKDSWLSIVFAAGTALVVLVSLFYPSLRTLRVIRRHLKTTDASTSQQRPDTGVFGVLHAQYRDARAYVFVAPLLSTLAKALAIAFVHASGPAQIGLFLLTDLVQLSVLLLTKPHHTRKADILAVFIAGVKVGMGAMMVAFVERLEVKAIPRVAVGIVMMVVWGIAVLVVMWSVFVNLRHEWGLRSGRGGRRGRRGWRGVFGWVRSSGRSGSSDESMLEKGIHNNNDDAASSETNSGSTPSTPDTERPRNPTPHQRIPLDPSILRPYPDSTPTPTTASMSTSFGASVSVPASAASGSTTLGSVLSRRSAFEGLGLERVLGGGSDVDEGEEWHSVPPSPSVVPATSPMAGAASPAPTSPHPPLSRRSSPTPAH
ncbi:hypothetical protein BD410DRAFT_723980 [Rickenella mellea]|uniref:ML-like domain-containing protein n=1 Tax=Rickenella mellea TaxID=50990 RepID=A0A4Y7Q4H7_9AGAM|nr:hypothetical protein BD410DRAFT_723980 [Rickenella mellea]